MEAPSPSYITSQATFRAMIVSNLPGISRDDLYHLRFRIAGARDEKDVKEIVRPFCKEDFSQNVENYDFAWDEARRNADFSIKKSEAIKARIISILDEKEFPTILQHIPDPPFFLSYRGASDLIVRGGVLDQRNGLAIVGTRNATHEGISVTKWLVESLVNQSKSPVMVSGLSEGIDIVAHRAAMKHGLRTVAVMGTDLQSVYPAKHLADMKDILAHRGVVVSEYFPAIHTKYHTKQLTERDRLRSGLSCAIMAIQFGVKSSTMDLLCMAALQGRTLFAYHYNHDPSISLGSEVWISPKNSNLVPRGKSAKMISRESDLRLLSDLFKSVSAKKSSSASSSSDSSYDTPPSAQGWLFDGKHD